MREKHGTDSARAPALRVAFVLVLAFVAPGLEGADSSSGRYGSAADGMPYDLELRLTPRSRSVSVYRYDTVRFVTTGGREFRWRFDTERPMDVFPLERIAPAGLGVPGGVTVYVVGEVPIAP